MPALIAHRGYPQRFPENTLASIEAAITHGARHFEVDVQLSADGVPVLFHDDALLRLCRRLGHITSLELAEIRRLRVGGEPVPTLADLEALLQRHPEVHAFVELKQESIEAAGESAVLAAVTAVLAPVRSQSTLISFHAGILRLAIAQRWACGWVTDAWPTMLPEVLQQGLSVWFCDVAALPPDGLVNPFTVPLAVYEVSDPGLAREIAARGADFIETNDIAGMRRELPGWT